MGDTLEVLCYRCGKIFTRKRVDGKPVCQLCFLLDAMANRGIAPDYHDLTPAGIVSIPQAGVDRLPEKVVKTVTEPKSPRKPASHGRVKASDAPLSDKSKARLRELTA